MLSWYRRVLSLHFKLTGRIGLSLSVCNRGLMPGAGVRRMRWSVKATCADSATGRFGMWQAMQVFSRSCLQEAGA
jgi:hypothetical protein